jgi:HD superfamily phosphodiesterase
VETGDKAFRAAVIKSIEIEAKRFGFKPEITAKLAKSSVAFMRSASSTTVARMKKAKRSAGAADYRHYMPLSSITAAGEARVRPDCAELEHSWLGEHRRRASLSLSSE